MIEIDGIKLYTEREWERKHRHVLKRQLDKGVTRTWRATPGSVTATWYREDQTRPWGKAEVKRFRMEAKKKRERERVEAEEAARRAEVEEARRAGAELAETELLRRCWGVKIDDDVVHGMLCPRTSWQWVSRGLVPIDGARWYTMSYDLGSRGKVTWWYCSWWDVRPDRARAEKLLETGPSEPNVLPDGRPYDGRPWW